MVDLPLLKLSSFCSLFDFKLVILNKLYRKTILQINYTYNFSFSLSISFLNLNSTQSKKMDAINQLQTFIQKGLLASSSSSSSSSWFFVIIYFPFSHFFFSLFISIFNYRSWRSIVADNVSGFNRFFSFFLRFWWFMILLIALFFLFRIFIKVMLLKHWLAF